MGAFATGKAIAEKEAQRAARSAGTSGQSSPLGATVFPGGVNFSVYSRNASGVELLLFDREDDAIPAHVITIDPTANCHSYYWHVFVPGCSAGAALWISSPRAVRSRQRNAVRSEQGSAGSVWARRGCSQELQPQRRSARTGDNAFTAMKSVVVDCRAYDWEGDTPLHRPASHTIIYEMHVRGFTRHPSSGVSEKARGTYAGLIEKIPYLQQLGITAVELLPVFQFDAAGCSARARELLGICAGLVLRAASGLQLEPRSARAGKRVSRHGEGAAPGGHRGHSRCCFQSHGRRRPPRADAELSRAGEQRLLHSRTRPLALRELQRHGKHAQRQSSRRSPDDPG